MIEEVRDPSLMNLFANRTLNEDIDFTAAVANPANVFLAGEHGCFSFIWTAPETFEVHAMVGTTGRGRWAVEAGRAAIAEMARRGMTHLWARICPSRPEIAVFARLCGLSDAGTHIYTDIGSGSEPWPVYNWRA